MSKATLDRFNRIMSTAKDAKYLGVDDAGFTRLIVETKNGKLVKIKFRAPTDAEWAESNAVMTKHLEQMDADLKAFVDDIDKAA